MKRLLAVVGAVALTASSLLTATAQTNEPVNADGSYVVANDDGVPIVSGAGEDIVYGDINTGGGGGEVLGDPNAVYSPLVPDNPGPDGGLLVMPGAGDGLIGGVPIRPAAPDATTNTVTSLANNNGNATENIPVEALAPESPAPSDGAAAPIGFCAQYATWYDAQVAYENLGTTAADPALVQEVDADYDGIACEGTMA
jgi:hypothetical protein